MAKMAERRLDQFNAQELANTAWAFAIGGEPPPALLDPILVLDTLEVTTVEWHMGDLNP